MKLFAKMGILGLLVFALLFGTGVFLFNTDLGAVAYEKFFKGNVLFGQSIHMRDHVNGNRAEKNEFQGLTKTALVSLGTMTDGSVETIECLDDNPTGEWTEIDSGTAVLLTADTTYYRVGTTSLKIALTSAAVATDGASGTSIGGDDCNANESIGFWIYSTRPLAAGDFYIYLDDDAGNDWSGDVGAVPIRKWTWIEVDISGCNGGAYDCDNVAAIQFQLSAAGATSLGAVDVYLDAMYKWDAADEEALGNDIMQDGVLGVMSITTADGQAHTIDALAEWTDYFTHYEATNDFIVTMGDLDLESGIALISYK